MFLRLPMLLSFLPFFFLILPLPINAFRSDELDQSESAESDNTALSRTLSKMWRMDTKHRQKFGEQMEFLAAEEGEGPAGRTKLGPIGDRNPSVLSRPVISAYKSICHVLLSVRPNESKSRQIIDEAIDAFLARLEQNKLFKKASRLYSKSLSSADPSEATKSLGDSFRSLWFLPSGNPAFRTLMCRFSAKSGNWLSFYLDQPNLEVNRIRMGKDGQDVLVEFDRQDGEEADGRGAQRQFPLGDSIEFELSAITLCALFGDGQKCSFSLGEGMGQAELRVDTKTSADDDQPQQITAFYFDLNSADNSSSSSSSSSSSLSLRISDEFPSSSSSSIQNFREESPPRSDGTPLSSLSHRHNSPSDSRRRWETRGRASEKGAGRSAGMGRAKSLPSLRVPQNIQQLVEQLWAQDRDRVDESVARVDWQRHMPGGHRVVDVSSRPLLNVSDESFLQQPIYAALVDIYNEQLFHPPVCQGEPPMNAQRRAKFDRLWQLVIRSDVFRTAYDYLDSLGKTGGDFDSFTRELFDRWFGMYTRCKKCNEEGVCRRSWTGPLGSSGWEHVFSGEWEGEIVDGHHNWVRYYLQQRAGDIEYHGYYVKARQGNFIGTIQYKWGQYLKRIGGFLIRTSPAFDFSLFTVCALSEPGNQGCKFQLMDTPMFVTSFLESCTIDGSLKRNFCIATTFPGIRHSNDH